MEEERKESSAPAADSAANNSAGSGDEESQDMGQLLRESELSDNFNIGRGEIVTGEIIQITDEFIFLNLGAKIDGKIPVSELLEIKDLPEKPKVGGKIEAAVVSINRETGDLILSLKECRKLKAYKAVSEALEADSFIEGRVIERRGDYYMVDIGIPIEVKAKEFLNRTDDSRDIVSKILKFKITKFIPKKDILYMSRRAYLYEARETQRKNLLQNLQVGKRVKGVVKDIKNYGMFVDLGGIDGLVHRTDISYAFEPDVSSMYKKGDEIEVLILKIEEPAAEPVESEPSSPETLKLPEDRRKRKEDVRITLGIKQLKNDPWHDVAERYQAGAVVKGRVARVFDFGAFIELEEGVDAFSSREDISWSKNLTSPRRLLKPGDSVQAKIISVNAGEKKIAVSLKELLPDPWIGVMQKYRVGQRIKGKVVKVTERGAFIQLDDTVDGFVSVNDISWQRGYMTGNQYFRTGQDVEATITNVSATDRKIDLSIRALEPNPWEVFKRKNPGNSIIKGRIRRVTSAGLVIQIEGSDLEGFVHARDIQKEKAEQLDRHFKANDPIEVALVEVQVDRQRIRLSLRKYESVLEAREMDKFIAADTEVTEKLGSFFNLKPVRKEEKEKQ